MLKKRLGEILLEANAIDEYQLRSALGFQKKWGGRLGKVLVDNHFITEETLLLALQRQTGIAAVDLKMLQIPDYVLKLIPKEFAEKNHLLPVRLEGDPGKTETLVVAMSDPTNLKALDEIQFKTGKKVKPVLAGEIALARAIRMYYFGETDGLDLDMSSRDTGRDEDMVVVQGTLEQAAMAGEAAGFPTAAASAPPVAATPPIPQPAPNSDDPFSLLDALDGPAGTPLSPAPGGIPPPASDPAYATMEEIEDIFSNVEAPADPAPVSPSAATSAPPAIPETVIEAVDIELDEELDEEISPLDEPPAPAQAAPPPAAPAPTVNPVPPKPAAAPAPKPAPAPVVQAPPAQVAPNARVPVPPATPKPAAPVPPQPVQPAANKPAAAPKGIGDLLSRVGLTAPAEAPAVKPAAPVDKATAAAKTVPGTDPWLESLLVGAPEALEEVGGASRVISTLIRLLLKKRLLSEKEILDALKPKS